MRYMFFLVLLLVGLAFPSPFVGDSYLSVDVFAEYVVEGRNVNLNVSVVPAFSYYENGSYILKEVNADVDVYLFKGDTLIDSCSFLTNKPFYVGNRLLYKGECSFSFIKEDACYRVEANATYFYGKKYVASDVETICFGKRSTFEDFVASLGLTNYNNFLNPFSFAFFTVFMLALLSLNYRGIMLHQIVDITHPKIRQKLFKIKYSYIIYHPGKIIGDDINAARKYFYKLGGNSIEGIYKMLERDPTGADLIRRLTNLGVGKDQILYLITELWVKGVRPQKDNINNVVLELSKRVREIENVVSEYGRKDLTDIRKIALDEIHKNAVNYISHLKKENKEEEALLLSSAATMSLMVASHMHDPKKKVGFFKRTAKLFFEYPRRLFAGERGTALFYPWKNLFGEHIGEGLIGVGRALRAVGGYEVAKFLYDKVPSFKKAVDKAAEKALKREKLSFKEKFLLSIFGRVPGDEIMNVRLDNHEVKSKQFYKEIFYEMYASIIYKAFESFFKKKGLDLDKAFSHLKEGPEGLPKFMEEMRKVVRSIDEREWNSLYELIKIYENRLKDELSKDNIDESRIASILDEFVLEVDKRGILRDSLEEIKDLVNVYNSAIEESGQGETYMEKVWLMYEALDRNKDVLEEKGLWRGASEDSMYKHISNIVLYLIDKGEKVVLRDVMVGFSYMFLERNFGIDKEGNNVKGFDREFGREGSLYEKFLLERGAPKLDAYRARKYIEKSYKLLNEMAKDVYGLNYWELKEKLSEGFFKHFEEKFIVSDELFNLDYTDFMQKYYAASSYAYQSVDVALKGKVEEPFNITFSNFMTSFLKDLLRGPFGSRVGLLSSDRIGAFENMAYAFHHYMSLAAYLKAYDELGYYREKIRVGSSVKDWNALKERAKEIADRFSSKELLDVLYKFGWEVPLEFGKDFSWFITSDGAKPVFFGNGNTPLILIKDSIGKVYGNVSPSHYYSKILSRGYVERKNAFFTGHLYYLDEYGRKVNVDLAPMNALEITPIIKLIEEKYEELGLTKEERFKLLYLLGSMYSDEGRLKEGAHVAMDEIDRVIRETPLTKNKEKMLKEELSNIGETMPRVLTDEELSDMGLSVEEIVRILHKLEDAFVEGKVKIEDKGVFGFKKKTTLSKDVFASLVSTISFSTGRMLFPFFNTFHISTGYSYPKIEWRKALKSPLYIPFLLVYSSKEWFKEKLSKYYLSIFRHQYFPNMYGYLDVTRYRTTASYIMEEYLMGLIPKAVEKGLISDIERREIESKYLDLLVRTTWIIPRNEFVVAYALSPNLPTVGLSAGYHMGPLVGYNKWYTEFIYDYFPIGNLWGNYAYVGRGVVSPLSGEYVRGVDYAKKYGITKPSHTGKFWDRLKSNVKYYGALSKAKVIENTPTLARSLFTYGLFGITSPVLAVGGFYAPVAGTLQKAFMNWALVMGAYQARIRRMFSATYRYPSYADFVLEYDEEELEKFVSKKIDEFVNYGKDDVTSVVHMLSWLDKGKRAEILSKLYSNVNKYSKDKKSRVESLLDKVNELNVLNMPKAKPYWVREKSASPDEQYYGEGGPSNAYAHLLHEMVKQPFFVYTGIFSPFLSIGGALLHSMFSLSSQKGGKTGRLASRLVGRPYDSLKLSHLGLESYPGELYEGVKLHTRHFGWHISGSAGFYEKTIGVTYLNPFSWEYMSEPWGFYNYEIGSFISTPSATPYSYRRNIREFIIEKSYYNYVYSSTSNLSYAFIHPAFGLSYLANKLLNNKRKKLRKHSIKSIYTSMDVWGPYSSWKDRAVFLLSKTTPVLSGLAFTFSPLLLSVNPLIAGAALGGSSMGIGKFMFKSLKEVKCPVCGNDKIRGEACRVCGYKPFSYSF